MRRYAFMTALVAAMVLAFTVRPAVAGSVVNTKVPVNFVLPDPATGELVQVDANLHIQLLINNSSAQLQLKANGSGVGLGSPSLDYIFQSDFKGSIKVGPGAQTLSLSLRAQLISKGSGDNISIDGKLRLHFDANGNLVGVQFDPLFPPKITG